MSDVLLVLAAVGLVLVSLLVWMNIFLIRQRHQRRNAGDHAAVPEVTVDEGSREAVSSGEPAAPADQFQEAEVWAPGDISVGKVFGRAKPPFYLNTAVETSVHSDTWLRCFHRLSCDQRVLGWLVFVGDELGAADHGYDADFVRVLQQFRSSLERLRTEAGLSSVSEASIIGHEGKVWFLTGSDDVWFALFMEAHADVHDVVEDLLTPVLPT